MPSDPRICLVEGVQGAVPAPIGLQVRTARAASGDFYLRQPYKNAGNISLGGEGRKPFRPTWHKWLPGPNGWVAIFELTYIPICLFIFLLSHIVIMGAFL